MLGSNIPITIAGNKADLEKNRHVKEDEAEQYADFARVRASRACGL